MKIKNPDYACFLYRIVAHELGFYKSGVETDATYNAKIKEMTAKVVNQRGEVLHGTETALV